VASGDHTDVRQAMEAMSALGEIHQPKAALADWNDKRFKAFEALQQVGRSLRSHS
jgi:D-ribulokinase